MSESINNPASDLETRAWEVLNAVLDPEIPVLSIVDLGIVRSLAVSGSAAQPAVIVGLAPTYSGCPATEVIEASVITALKKSGFGPVDVQRVLSPPWTTDWISEAGREKLRGYGIAPPAGSASKLSLTGEAKKIACPNCGSQTTTRVSEYGSTPCKASYKCNACLEPFEYFKCI